MRWLVVLLCCAACGGERWGDMLDVRVLCCGADLAGDRDGGLYGVSDRSTAVALDPVGGTFTVLFEGALDHAITFHNGQLWGLNDGALAAYDLPEGTGGPTGLVFSEPSLDALASPTP